MALRTSAVAFSLLRAAAGRGAAAQAGAGLLAGQTLPHALLQRASTSAAAQPAADAPKQPQNVPEGHRGSDLSSTVCNIGLGRRRDLTLRQDLCLHAADGAKLTLATVFKGKKVLLVGFPGGPVCEQQHVPGYVKMADALAKEGVDQVALVSVAEPAALRAWAEKQGLKADGGRLALFADGKGAFARALGVELPAKPACQRYAAVVEDGILLKLKVENSPAELKVTDAASMLALFRSIYD